MGVRIRERKSGRWWVFVNHKGNRVAKYCGDLGTAEEARRIIEQQLTLGLFQFPKREPKKQIPTLEDYYKRFSETYLKAGVRESTAEPYRQCFECHILPAIGATSIDEISREQLKGLVAGLVADGLARYTIRLIASCICSIMSHALEDRLITFNPATKLGRFFAQAPVIHNEIEPLTAAEVLIFLEKARLRDLRKRANDPEYYPLFLCAIHTGLRAGELAGLQWIDIDWNGKFLMVRRSIRNGRIWPTKTSRIRRVDISDDLLEELREYRRHCLQEAMKQGRNETEQWVFASRNGTPLDMHNVERRPFKRILQLAGLRQIRLHDLCHTMASLLIQNGASLVYVKEQLGHSSIRVTVDIYGHLAPGANRHEMNRLPSLRKPIKFGNKSQAW